MKKEDFLKTLTPEQRKAVEILLDFEYAKGYRQGKVETSVVMNW